MVWLRILAKGSGRIWLADPLDVSKNPELQVPRKPKVSHPEIGSSWYSPFFTRTCDWSLAGASAYRVQVSSDEKFDRIVRDLKVDSGSAELGSLANGNWFARVRGIDAQGLEGFDTVKQIEVKNGLWRVSYSSLSLLGGQTVLGFTGQQANGQPFAGSNYSAVVARDGFRCLGNADGRVGA